jgi:hypothetical protein
MLGRTRGDIGDGGLVAMGICLGVGGRRLSDWRETTRL